MCVGMSGCGGREWDAHTAVYSASLCDTSERGSTSQWIVVVCAKPMRDAVVHGNVAPRRDYYAMAISAVQSAAHHARRDGIRPSLPSSGLFRRNGQVSVETNEEEPRRRYARSCISLLSVPAVLSMRRTFSHTAMPTSHDQYQNRRQLSVSLVSTRARPLVLQSSRDQLSSL